jgi:hypothetical protein
VTARGLRALLVALALLACRSSAADTCLDAPVQGQKLVRAGHPIAAREKFAACAQKACPAEIVKDCETWMQDATRSIPSIVTAVRDAAGSDVEASLGIDGGPAAPLAARAIELDPGPHHLVFRLAHGRDVARDVVLREGEKDRPIVVTLEDTAPGAVPPPAAAPAPRSPSAPSRPVPVSVWIAGGVGGAALATFAVLGGLGVSARSSDHCDTGCSTPQKKAVDGEFLAADVSLGVGVVALGIAAWLYLAREPAPAPVAAVLGILGVPGRASLAGHF